MATGAEYASDYHFSQFAKQLANAIRWVADAEKEQESSHERQQRQMALLVGLEDEFRRILCAQSNSDDIYLAFIRKITSPKSEGGFGNLNGLRPFFRERAAVLKDIIAAVENGDLQELSEYSFNFRFVSFVINAYSWKEEHPLRVLERQMRQIRNQLITENLPLAVSRAKVYWSRNKAKAPSSHLTYMDVIQIAAEGLATAVDKFDPTHPRAALRACFVPGTKVLTTKGVVNIEDIQSGDRVFDKEGIERPVVMPTSRYYLGNIVKLKVTGASEEILATEDHRFQRVLEPGKYEWIAVKDLVPGDRIRQTVLKGTLSSVNLHADVDVVSVETQKYEGIVHCMQVDTEHSFTLAGGLGVANCLVGRMHGNFNKEGSASLMHFFPKDARKLWRANAILARAKGEVTFEALAEGVNVDLPAAARTDAIEIAQLLTAASDMRSMDASSSEEDKDGKELPKAQFAAPISTQPDAMYESRETLAVISKYMHVLTPIERKILRLRGLDL